MPGIGDMRNLVRQAQRLQAELAARQQKLSEARVEATAGGGMVRAVVNGQGELLEFHLSPEVLEGVDSGLLEDLVVAAVHEAQAKARELARETMADLTGGVPPGMWP
jgi:hypothetical protein